MTTDLELATNGNIPAVPAPGTTAAALDMLRQHAEMMNAAHQLAVAMVGTQMVPAAYRGKPDDAAAAILYGAELGLNPIQSLQQVFPVHGQPAIYSRTMVALLKARGYRFRTEATTDEGVTVTGTAPSGETETSTWTIDRARKAGYTTNKKYESDPQAMLYAKACAEVARKLAPDVLLGISHTREDLELEPAPVRATSERLDRPATATAGPATVRDWTPPEADEVSEPPAEESAPEMATPEEQATLADLLEAEGLKTPAAKRKYLSEQFGRTIKSSRELTAAEARSLTHFLRHPDGEQLDTVAEATDSEPADDGQLPIDEPDAQP
ncbi:hypothetical protein IU433_12375 [Nocardia puris]|uniref:hypothetical protein n=1 Tax=Nocardia puris TaxID=208602 RepID=UPI0018946E7B|nr:hypothetical protein [Nocardia puris]MBF6459833.1 hypothetical protein [Nocardia puris]